MSIKMENTTPMTPQEATEIQRLWGAYQQDMIASAGNHLFIFGMKLKEDLDQKGRDHLKTLKTTSFLSSLEGRSQFLKMETIHQNFISGFESAFNQTSKHATDFLSQFLGANQPEIVDNATALYGAGPSTISAPAEPKSTVQRSILIADVKPTDVIIHYPKREAFSYYIALCPKCNRTFENSQSAYSHINQSLDHTYLLDNPSKLRPFVLAMAICGIRVTDATEELVTAHNNVIMEQRHRVRLNESVARKRKFSLH